MSDSAKPAPKDEPFLYISSSPHVGSPVGTRKIMSRVLIALAPAAAFGVALYGMPALLTIAVSITAAELTEALFRKVINREARFRDLSAAVTGLLLALIIPPGTPLWITALGAMFAILMGKEFFGGLGANVFNPALIGRAFMLLSFPVSLTAWAVPRSFFSARLDALTSSTPVDVLTGPTPLGILKLGGSLADVGADLVSKGLASSGEYWSVIQSLFLGSRGGSIGESSIVLILIGFIFLLVTRTIDWRAPVSLVAAAAATAFILGADPLFSVMSGGLLFGAVFMATDYVTVPMFAKGKIVFGIGAGIIAMLIRQLGNFPEGISYGILIMNTVTPFLNRIHEKKYGYIPKKAAKGDAK